MNRKKQNKIIKKAIKFVVLNMDYSNIKQSTSLLMQLKTLIKGSDKSVKENKDRCERCKSKDVVIINDLYNECNKCKSVYRIVF